MKGLEILLSCGENEQIESMCLCNRELMSPIPLQNTITGTISNGTTDHIATTTSILKMYLLKKTKATKGKRGVWNVVKSSDTWHIMKM